MRAAEEPKWRQTFEAIDDRTMAFHGQNKRRSKTCFRVEKLKAQFKLKTKSPAQKNIHNKNAKDTEGEHYWGFGSRTKETKELVFWQKGLSKQMQVS